MTISNLLATAALVGLTATAAAAQDFSLAPAFGEADLITGFQPDPHIVELVAGGDQFFDDGVCAGYVATAPDYRIQYEAGDVFPLNFVAESEGDTILLVNAPDGSWHCNDDFFGLNPSVSFEAPLSGQYDIWVGTYLPAEFPDANLIATEFAYN